ncbi:MAG: hypothetical protein QOE54_754 [Streptosporangiaceae bacterium]|jgi:hypothetical protein|nr:hypothetical protein [Streptosporangiaceae bacterium]
MSAQPIHEHDPRDPQVILAQLPERARPGFLAEYHAAVDAAHDLAGYRRLQDLLHLWSIRTIAYSKPGYYEAMEQARQGTGETVPLVDVISECFGLSPEDAEAYWQDKITQARARRQAS